MRFKFDAEQPYQIDAIEAVMGIFEGQPYVEPDTFFGTRGGLMAIPNRLDLEDSELLDNLRTLQRRDDYLEPDDSLACIEEEISTEDGRKQVRFPNFSIEMETGTGKTYVYIRTALELGRRYGLKKFVVVVPSVAVREGVLKTFAVTEEHFSRLYDNMPYRYYAYDSANLTQVRQFALADSVEFMVMTLDSFNKASNVINQSTDRLQGETPIFMIQAAHPVLILDEPQNMESEQSVRALAALDPLFALRYSATHRNPYNVVYRLTPHGAYRQGLVKRIEVASVLRENDPGAVFLRLESITPRKKTLTARLVCHSLTKGGVVKEKAVTVKAGDSLEEKTGRPEYRAFEVEEIGGSFVRFANDVELDVGEERGADKEAIFEAQIRYTIEEHFRKQRRLKDAGIKVLSLFFVDRVANYAPEDGILRKLFEKAFDDVKGKYPDWSYRKADEVQAAYFAAVRRKGGEMVFEDSTSGEAQKDVAAYELIMKNKERLLSFEEPVSFIFSHSALREGWDNPNVGQICTLNQSVSTMKKRQEVGRGVRLVVDQEGSRVHDESVNVLTVIANESYQSYVAQLQSETEAGYGTEGTPPPPPLAQKPPAKLRKSYTLSPEFEQLWERIREKTRYAVEIDTEKLIDDVVAELGSVQIKAPRVVIARGRMEARTEKDEFEAYGASIPRTATTLRGRQVPNLIDVMANLMEHITPAARVTRRTLLEIYKRTQDKAAAIDNPHEFATETVRIIKRKLADQLVEGIRYEKLGEWYEMKQFEDEMKVWGKYIVPASRSVYDHVDCDSLIEKSFVEDLEKLDFVKLYLKLPRWFTVPTPVGDYNPDWAVVAEDRDEFGRAGRGPLIYLISETKGTKLLEELRASERRKILCGERHFKGALTGLDYKLAVRAPDLIS